MKNFTQLTPVHAFVAPRTMAPKSAAQGTGMSALGQSAGQAVAYTRAFIGLDVTDANPGSPPREAPV